MQDLFILGILVVAIIIGLVYTIHHFNGKSSCCGGGSSYISKKKLKNVIATKTYIVEGMVCENCVARVLRYINDMDGVAGKINLKKKQLIVSMEREVSDEEIIAAVTKAGYEILTNQNA